MEYEHNGSHAKLMGVTYFAPAPFRSYFHDPQKNEIYFLKNLYSRTLISKRKIPKIL